MASSNENEATQIVSSDSRSPTLTQRLTTCAPSSWFLSPPHHDRACYSTTSRVQADAGTTAYDCVARRLGGLQWGTPASPGVRVLGSFFGILEQHPSLLDLFREELDAINNAPRRRMPRKSERNVESSFTGLFYAGLESATAGLLNQYAAITEAVGASSASASASTSATRPRYSVWLDEPESALRTQGDAIIFIGRGPGDIGSSISIEYKRRQRAP